MKAAVCHEFGQPLVVEELAIDPPGPGEVAVRLVATAICHSDIHAIDGAWGGALPAVHGHEAAGVVETVGSGVDRLRPGDHVVVTLIRHCGHCFFCGGGQPSLCESSFALDRRTPLHGAGGAVVHQGLRTGAFAEQVVVEQSQAVAIDRDVPLASAALLACGVLTGVGAVTNVARVEAGSSVVVVGAGGVGLNSIQAAALAGATPVIAIDLAKAKLEAALAFGATDVIDAGSGDPAAVVRQLTGGRGADYVLVAVGSARAIVSSRALMRRGGSMVLVGMPAAGVEIGIEAVDLAHDGQSILGCKMGSAQPAIDIPKLIELYRQGRLKLDELITERYPLTEINRAIAAVKQGAALRNVILF